MATTVSRSPSSPSRSLGSCYDDVLKLYDAFPNAPFNSAQIANILNMSATSGAFKSLLSDLKQYGLLSRQSSKDFVISEEFKELSIADARHSAEIKFKLATNPKLFTQVIEHLGNHLPDSKALAGLLVARFDFNKAKAEKAAKALRSSLEWADCIDAKGNVLKPGLTLPAEIPHNGSSLLQQGIANAQTSSELNEGTRGLAVDIPLGEDRIVRVSYPANMNSKEAQKVGAVLGILTATPVD